MDRDALLNQVISNFGGNNANQGQQIALSKVSSDLGYNPQDVALALARQNSADAINQSLSPDFSSSSLSGQSGKLDGFPITQPFGNKSNVEVFSHGINTGVDVGVPKNTPVALPKGKWKVVSAFNGARSGYVGDNENQGYGNSVLVKNVDTGEQIRFSHLNMLHVPSDTMEGGQVIGLSGATGNVTGPHLDITYKDSNGHLADFMETKYAAQIGLGQ